jgi:hypothetical protein
MACSVFSGFCSSADPRERAGAVPPVPRIAGANVARAGVIMPVRCDAIGHGDVLALPALRQTSKG